MQDYLLSDQDIVLSQYDLALADGDVAAAQRIKQRLQLWAGEWFLNTNAGVPWLEDVLGQSPSVQALTAIFNDAILADPDVDSIASITLDYVGNTRVLSFAFEALLVSGITVSESLTVWA